MTVQNLETKDIKNTDNCLQLSGISWGKFKDLETSFESVPGVRLIYLDGALEIVILGSDREYYKRTISLLLEAYLRAQKIRFYSQGSATLGSPEITGQKEPDESYSVVRWGVGCRVNVWEIPLSSGFRGLSPFPKL